MEISLYDAAVKISQAGRLVLTAHIHPDGDCLGSMLALYSCLRRTGKEVTMLLDDAVPAMYQFLPGYDEIRRPVTFYDGVELLVVLDASDEERIGRVKEVVKAPILNIDHHISNTKFADYWYVDSQAAATGEIVFELLKMLNLPVDAVVACCLFTAIATDCGFFRYANTTATTLRYAAELVEKGAQPHIISENLETKPLDSIVALTKALDTLELHHDGRIAAITVDTYADGAENTEGFINYPRNIEGVELAVMFKVIDEETVRVSFRSRKTDVSKLALLFGGGGHARAAGCTIRGSLTVVKDKVFQAAIRALQE
ncbi:DHH family phosphoesterase [Sporolituus thermophilus]|uniref:Phosphoesterase RecJ domain-containing protein n=1 Tax=Sporolituus thermophilus DSM 23256 TaxID=1123285 RepID=A0A1G7I0Z3_9FIRM|nr:bifunctional oligoribonuclease/PAP phosphatase NrnA [Sporolituus thermophilus]SDF06420.1 phosphoesterase RecJ domain-containing protein [Sporolituus thermophilus DSM 23256]